MYFLKYIKFIKFNELIKNNNHYFISFIYLFIFWQKLHRDFIVKDLAGKPMKAMDILAIYIKYLKDSLLKAINNCKCHHDFQFSHKDIDFVLVVPASCGDGAKMFMREAAIKVSYISIYRSLGMSYGLPSVNQSKV